MKFILMSAAVTATMMSLAIRELTCEVGCDDKYNHKDKTGKRERRDNIDKDLGCKNNVKWTSFFKLKSKANTFKHKR